MKRIAIVAGLALVAACAKTDKNAMDTTTAAGMVVPATDSTGAMGSSSTSGSMSGSSTDTAHMGGSNMSSGSSMSSGTMTPTPDNKTGGAMGGDSAGMGGSHGAKTMGKGDTLKKKPATP